MNEVTFYVDADRNIPVSGFADLKSLGLGFQLLEKYIHLSGHADFDLIVTNVTF